MTTVNWSLFWYNVAFTEGAWMVQQYLDLNWEMGATLVTVVPLGLSVFWLGASVWDSVIYGFAGGLLAGGFNILLYFMGLITL